jgi:hypothetical protein
VCTPKNHITTYNQILFELIRRNDNQKFQSEGVFASLMFAYPSTKVTRKKGIHNFRIVDAANFHSLPFNHVKNSKAREFVLDMLQSMPIIDPVTEDKFSISILKRRSTRYWNRSMWRLVMMPLLKEHRWAHWETPMIPARQV